MLEGADLRLDLDDDETAVVRPAAASTSGEGSSSMWRNGSGSPVIGCSVTGVVS